MLGPGASNRILNGLAKVVVPGVITFFAFYAFGIPAGVAFAFPGHLGLVGLWLGLNVGMVVMVGGLVLYLFCFVDWDEASRKARARALARKGERASSSTTSLASADSAAANDPSESMQVAEKLPSQIPEEPVKELQRRSVGSSYLPRDAL